MKLGSNFITHLKARFKRDVTDPEQRAIILEKTLKEFGKRLKAAPASEPAARQEAYALLEQLAFAYEGKDIDALEVYREAYERLPSDTHLLRTVVGLLRARDARDKDAINYYRKLADVEPNNLQLLQLLADCYQKTQQPFPLMITYERIVKKYQELQSAIEWGEVPPSRGGEDVQKSYQNAVHQLGEIYANMGKTDESAISIYRQILHTDYENVTVLKVMVQTYLQKGRTDTEALEVYEHSLAYYPGDRKVRLLLAKGYIETGRQQEGLIILEKIYEENPDDDEVLGRLMEYFLAHNLLDAHSLPYYEAYFERNPGDKSVLLLLTNYLADQGVLTSKSVALYKRFLSFADESTPDRERFMRILGRYYFENNRWGDLIEIYEELRRIAPDSKDAIIPLATAYSEYKRSDEEALKIYQRAMSLGSRNEKVHTLLCKYLYESKKRGGAAVKIFKDSLALNPKNAYARLGLCDYYLFICEYENALTEALKHLRFFHGDQQAIDYAAQCVAQIATKHIIERLSELDDETRLSILRAAFRQSPKGTKQRRSIILALSRMYQESERIDEQAAEIYLAALPTEPQNTRLLSLLTRYYLQQGDKERTFQYDYETFKVCRVNCTVARTTDLDVSPPPQCPGSCIRLARYLISTETHHPALRDILRCAWRAGESSSQLIKHLAPFYLDEDSLSEEALCIYNALLKIDPSRKDARRMILLSHIERSEPEPVLRHCQERLSENPEDSDALDLLIRCLSTCRTTDERITYFLERLHKRQPERERISLALALLYSYQKNFSIVTLGIYESALRLRTDDVQLLVGLARCYESAGNLKKGAEVYEHILQSLPDDTTILARLAHTYRRMGLKTGHAIDIIRRAADADVFDVDLQLYLSDVYFKSSRTRDALEVIDHLLKNQPDSISLVITHLEGLQDDFTREPRVFIVLGYLYMEKGRYEEALNEFSHLSSNYGKFCGDLVDAYNRILKKEPDYVRARVERGVIFKILGNFEDAIKDLEKAKDLAEDNANVLYELAECYAAYVAHLKKPPIELLYKLARLYGDTGEMDKCIEVYQRILGKQKGSQEAILSIGRAFHRKKNLDLALHYYGRLDKSYKVKDLLYKLGDDFYSKGELRKSKEAFNQIVAVDIAFRDVSLKLQELESELKEGTAAKRQREEIIEQLSLRARRRFELVSEVGQGTFGIVFKAYDKELDEVVALKVLPEKFSQDAEAQVRFRLEVKSARRLSHPNIVRIHDIGEEAGRKYISMEYIDGGDLRQLLAEKNRLSKDEMLDFSLQIASALEAAHRIGILHRDIKPANILITKEGSCKLTDFGIATIMAESLNSTADVIAGTPTYMPPEQNEGKPLVPTSDIYSLGVVMYEMLMGAPPFRTGNIAYHHIFTRPPAMRGIDRAIAKVVMRCLEKKPPARFQSIRELIYALKACRGKEK